MKVSTTENITVDLSDINSGRSEEFLNVNTREFNGNIEVVISQGVESAKIIFEPSAARKVIEKMLVELQDSDGNWYYE